jgi:predicted metal-dependent peptidase
MAVDPQYRIFYDPEFVLAQDLQKLATVVAHEVCHPLLRHYKRFAAFFGLTPEQLRAGAKKDPSCSADVLSRVKRALRYTQEWNIAADCEINHMLGRHPFPDGFCWTSDKLNPPMPRGLSAERYFEAIINDETSATEKTSGGSKEDGGEEEGSESAPSSTGSNSGEDSEDAASGGENSPPEQGGQCGSGCTGVPLPCEDVKEGEPRGVSAREDAVIRRKVESEMRKSQSAGALPGDTNRWSKSDKGGTTRWETILAMAINDGVETARGDDDYTYGRVSRYQEAVGWSPGVPVFQSLETPVVRVHVAIDTSASMTNSHIERAVAEVRRLLQDAECLLTVSSIDCASHKFVEVESVSDLIDAVKGGGGTSFIPLFDEFKKPQVEPPSILIVITDGDGPAPAVPPLFPVVWLLVNERDTPPYSPKTFKSVNYGKTVHVKKRIK